MKKLSNLLILAIQKWSNFFTFFKSNQVVIEIYIWFSAGKFKFLYVYCFKIERTSNMKNGPPGLQFNE